MSEPRALAVHRLGAGVQYEAGVAWQRAHAEAMRAGGAEALALLEHAPVYTLGARGQRDSVLASPAGIEASGARLVQSDRGGDVTFHGPGQLVAYPVLDLRARGLGPGAYVRALETAVIEALARLDVRGGRVAGRPGVWVDGAKLCAVGVRIRDGVSQHGIALNVDVDLAWFDAIVPCGIAGAEVTSLARLLPAPPPIHEVQAAFLEAFATVFNVEPHDASLPSPSGRGVGGEGADSLAASEAAVPA